MRLLTSGESHGPRLGLIVEGYPAGVPVDTQEINKDLKRRQGGYGRGGRMRIETDQVEVGSGIRHGLSLGSPILLTITNRDWARWETVMSSAPVDTSRLEHAQILGDQRLKAVEAKVTIPRPGHADLAGAMKYGTEDIRNILERSSARETATRVAAGALARIFLAIFGIRIGSYVQSIGGVGDETLRALEADEAKRVEDSSLRCIGADLESQMRQAIDDARERGDSLGGKFVVYVQGLPVGLGSHVHWDRRLDGRLAQALMSIPAIKGVECGLGLQSADIPGSQVHDAIYADSEGKIERNTNHAGGLEGGMTNGEPLLLRAAMKPIPTLYSPLDSVDRKTGEKTKASVERSDVCAVPAAAVVAEAMVAWVLADAFLEKFGGDCLDDIRRSYEAYRERI